MGQVWWNHKCYWLVVTQSGYFCIIVCSHIVQLELQSLFLVDMNQMDQVLRLRVALTPLQMLHLMVRARISTLGESHTCLKINLQELVHIGRLLDTLHFY